MRIKTRACAGPTPNTLAGCDRSKGQRLMLATFGEPRAELKQRDPIAAAREVVRHVAEEARKQRGAHHGLLR